MLAMEAWRKAGRGGAGGGLTGRGVGEDLKEKGILAMVLLRILSCQSCCSTSAWIDGLPTMLKGERIY